MLPEAAAQLLFPHFCAGCGTDVIRKESSICARCLHQLPETFFYQTENNPVEHLFWGRMPVQAAMAAYYFTSDSLLQNLLHELKYRGNRAVGIQLGQLMGAKIKEAPRFNPDVLIPVPLHPKKKRERGFNQAALLCEGIANILKIPVETDFLIKKQFTSSQTKKNRINRWENVDHTFSINPHHSLENKKILLVDDVLTTGATLEACGQLITNQPSLCLSIATLCYTFN